MSGKALGRGDERGDGETLQSALELVRSAVGELAHLGEGLDASTSS